jgi:hypothetical protein
LCTKDHKSGQCHCENDQFGADCSQTSRPIIGDSSSSTWSISSSVTVSGWEYFHFDIANVGEIPSSGLMVSMKRTSAVGDPDMYIHVNEWPTVAVQRWKSAGCDSCAGATDSKLTIPKAQLNVARYRIGIHGYCCDDSSFTLSITNPGSSTPMNEPSTYPLWLRVLILLTGLILTTSLVCLIVRCRKRRAHQYGLTATGDATITTLPVTLQGPVIAMAVASVPYQHQRHDRQPQYQRVHEVECEPGEASSIIPHASSATATSSDVPLVVADAKAALSSKSVSAVATALPSLTSVAIAPATTVSSSPSSPSEQTLRMTSSFPPNESINDDHVDDATSAPSHHSDTHALLHQHHTDDHDDTF